MRMRLVCVAVLLASMTTAACQQTPVVPVIETPPIEMKISLSDSVLVFGEIDTIRVIIKNTLDFVVRLPFATQCQDKLYIRNVGGAIVLPATGTYECARVSSQLTVPAGDSVVRTYLWTGGHSLYPPDPSAKLPAGRYFVSASMQATDYSVNAFPVAIRLAASR